MNGGWLDEREAAAWRAWHRLRAPLEAALNRQLADRGLSTADYSILVALSESPGDRLRARDLGVGLGWEKSRLSHQIRRMQARDLVRRVQCESDARGTLVALTPTGRDAIERAAPGHVATVRRLFIDALTVEQLDLLTSLGDAVLDRLRQEGCPDAGEVGCDGESSCAADTDGCAWESADCSDTDRV